MVNVSSGSVTAQPTNGSLAASPLLPRPLPFSDEAHPVHAAAASLQGILAVVHRLEEHFHSSGNAIASLANASGHASPIGAAPAPPPESSTQLLKTLEDLAGCTACGDAEVAEQMSHLRRGVAVLSQDLLSLVERFPALQSGSGGVVAAAHVNASPGSAASPTSQSRTPQVSPSSTTLTSAPRAARTPVNAHATLPATAFVAERASAPRSSVVTPATSPQLQAIGATAGRRSVSGLGDSVRSQGSVASSTTSPARGSAGAVSGGGGPAVAAHAAPRVLGSAVSPASPPLSHLLRPVSGDASAATLPASACTASVKRYLANCIEWPPRPRRRNVRLLAPPPQGKQRHHRRSNSAAEPMQWSDSDDEQQQQRRNGNEEGEDDFHTPATTASRQERGGGSGNRTSGRDVDKDRAASTAAQHRHQRPHTRADDFLRRLTEESPYDMSMLQATPPSPQHRGSDASASRNSSPDRSTEEHSSSGSSVSVEEEGRQRRLSASARAAGRFLRSGAAGGTSTGSQGKRKRSCNGHAARRSTPEQHQRRGRPTIVESVDALVLAQLRSDGVPLTDAMERELRGCVAADEGDANGDGGERLLAGKGSREQTEAQGASTAGFAAVLREVREMVRHGRAASSSSPPNTSSCPSSALSPSAPLPATAAWLAQIKDFCRCLEDMASVPSSDTGGEREVSDEEAGATVAARRGGRAARRSGTTTTSATKERVSNHNGSRRSTATSSTASVAAASSDTATDASASDFSIADEMFTSAEEAEDHEPHAATQSGMWARGTASHTTGGSASPSHTLQPQEAEAPSVGSLSGNTHTAETGVPTFSTANPSSAPPQQVIQEAMTHATAFGDFWLERGDAPLHSTHPAAAAAAATTRRRTSAPNVFAALPPATTLVEGPAARARRARRLHGLTSQAHREAFLRERYAYQRGLIDGGSPLRATPSDSEAATAVAQQTGLPAANYQAAAQELRALCSLLQTDLALVATLQGLSRLFNDAAIATPSEWPTSPSGVLHNERDGVPSLPQALATATRLLLSTQQSRGMQGRVRQERQLHDAAAQGYRRDGSTGVPTHASVTGSGAHPAKMAAPPPPLLLSSQHPVSVLGYGPLLARGALRSVSSPGAPGPSACPPTSAQSEGEEVAHNEEVNGEQQRQLERYIVSVAPYLLAWRSVSFGGQAGSACQEVAAITSSSAPPPTPLPLPVWVYLEAVTTELLEEARKLNALYVLWLQLFSDAAVVGAGALTAASTGGELLLHHVRHGGRAASVAADLGVAGPRLPLANSLERFVSPVSTHLIRSFDRLEARHLLHNVFHEVHLSDVVARARALRQQQQQRLRFQQQQQPQQQILQQQQMLSPTSSTRPPPHPVVAQRRSGRTTASSGGGVEEGETMDSFALPPGTLSSSPALRSAAGVQWSMRDAEQQQQQLSPHSRASARGGSSATNNDNNSDEEEQPQQDDSDVASNAQGGNNASRATNRSASTTSEPRHVIIEGFVRYLTSGAERLRAVGGRGSRHSEDNEDMNNNGGSSPTAKAAQQSQPPPPPQHNGLTLDVPHTSAILAEEDGRMAAATSNLALIRAAEENAASSAATQAPVERAWTKEGVSQRRYFGTAPAAFAMPPSSDDSNEEARATLQCRWQPVFQSTMCFCPVTRRRCLDPLVCGALLLRAPLPPHELQLSHAGGGGGASSPISQGGNSNGGGTSATRGSPSVLPGSAPLAFPATIRALRSGLERVMPTRPVGGGRPTPGPSVRRNDAAPQSPVPSATARTGGVASPSPNTGGPQRVDPPLYYFSNFFLRQMMAQPERVAVPRIMTQIPTTLYGDFSAAAAAASRGGSNGDTDMHDDEEDDEMSAVEVLTESARRALQVASLPIESVPVTRNLVPSPDPTQARWLNTPTLLDCGHVIAHKTFLDLRGNARRSTRAAAAAAMTVVCCPYCSKITSAKDALTLSYLF